MKNDNLPPVGTLWGDIPPEVRERLPVGTVLGPPRNSPRAASLTRSADGRWARADGDCVFGEFVTAARPILSYPTDAGTEDTPAPFALADLRHPDDRWYAHATTTRPDIGSVREALAEPKPFALKHTDTPTFNFYGRGGPDVPTWETAPLLPLYDTHKDPAMSTRPTPICHKTIAPSRETYQNAIARASDCIGSNCSLWLESTTGCGRCSEAPHATPWPDPYTPESE